jgi:hypothetical protein
MGDIIKNGINYTGGGGASSYNELSDQPQINGTSLSGNKTASDLGLQDAMQVTSLPIASADYLYKVYQYIGATGGGLTHNYYYECVSDGQPTPTYSWEQTDVQPHGETYNAGDGINIDANKEISIDPMPSEDMDDVIDELPTGNRVAVTGYVPLGTIIPVFRETAPKFFLICDGSTYNKADYPELAELLLGLTTHSQYEVDGDDTKFKVPDLRGEFIRGTGTNGHTNQGSGSAVGVHQDATELAMSFLQDNKSVALSGYAGTPAIGGMNYDKQYISRNMRYTNITGSSTTVETVTRSAITRPTNTSVLFCIAYKDIYSNPMNDYSTDEKVVGTWIDGKTLYQKTINFGALPNATVKKVAHGITNLKNVVEIKGCAIQGNATLPLPDTSVDDMGANPLEKFIRIIVSSDNNIQIATGTDRSAFTAYVTLRYTKTTDA